MTKFLASNFRRPLTSRDYRASHCSPVFPVDPAGWGYFSPVGASFVCGKFFKPQSAIPRTSVPNVFPLVVREYLTLRPSRSSPFRTTKPRSSRFLRRDDRMFVAMPSSDDKNSSKRVFPRRRSRTTSRFHRSPTRSSVQAMGQFDLRCRPAPR